MAESEWKGTVCNACYNACGILVEVRDGVIVDIAGDPKNPAGLGHICAKGKARIMEVYNPQRLKHPVRRRNPEKGMGVDPQWEEISWPEAMRVIAARLRAARGKDPNSVVVAHFDMPVGPLMRAWSSAFGTRHNNWSAAGLFCGMGSHTVNMITSGAFNSEIDFDHCKHAVLIGTQMGFMVDSNALQTTRKLAEARRRGMRLTVIDPVCGTAAGKADKWIPIRPGTDGALALGVVNLLVNEHGAYDAAFLRRRTNAVYLVRADGRYARDAESRRPLVWNCEAGRAEPYDACPAEAMALEGQYEVLGERCRPAFELLREHVRRYDPERVSEITTVPVADLRELAASLAREASIGETISIDGEELPYRPVAVNFKMGAVGHRHGMAAGLAIHLINIVLGAIDVPGGFLGVNPIGPYWEPLEGPDGLLVPGEVIRELFGYNSAFPGAEVRKPTGLTLEEIFPVAILGRAMYPFTIDEPERFGVQTAPEVLIHARVNLMMSSLRPADMARVLTKIPFMVSFATEIDETAEFADIVLPDAHDLERDDVFPANHPFAFVAPGPTDWYWSRRQAVVPPAGEARHWIEVMIDLMHELGLAQDFYQACNYLLDLAPELQLDPGGRYSVGEMTERQIAGFRGNRRKEEPTFEGTATWVTDRRTAREMYPGPFVRARLPVYNAYLLDKGAQVRDVVDALGLDWSTSDYAPLPDWAPPSDAETPDPQFDLYAVTFKLPFMALGRGPYNAWLSELAERHAYAYRVLMHRGSAARRGISEGDQVFVESRAGRIQGRVHLSDGIHPEAVGVAGIHGHWAKEPRGAAQKGLHFNALIPMDLKMVDKLSSAFDSKPRVRVYQVNRDAAGQRS